MYRIRIHARGGQGAKTASRILGSALFAEGFEVQDAPQYGAERRGAPILASVRAAHKPILERGTIERPALLIVADATLVAVATAGVLAGVSDRTVLLIHGEEDPETWRRRLGVASSLFTLSPALGPAGAPQFVGVRCAGAAARMLGVVSRDVLASAVREELGPLGASAVAQNLELALGTFESFAAREGCVAEADDAPSAASSSGAPEWVDVPFEPAATSAPDIHGSLTSVLVRTGLWRTVRPVIDYERCRHCHWICSTLCPDAAISVRADQAPEIDYDHCKGCNICVAVCPSHAIRSVPEALARRAEVEPT